MARDPSKKRIGRQMKQYTKDQFAKMASGNLVSDAERTGLNRNLQENAAQGLAAQQKALSRTQQALGTASPVQAGAITQGAQNLGKTASDMAVKASGQAETMAQALEEKRKAQVMSAGDRLIQRNREDAQFGIEMGLKGAEMIGELIGGVATGGASMAVT